MPMSYVLLVHRAQRHLLERKGNFNEALTGHIRVFSTLEPSHPQNLVTPG